MPDQGERLPQRHEQQTDRDCRARRLHAHDGQGIIKIHQRGAAAVPEKQRRNHVVEQGEQHRHDDGTGGKDGEAGQLRAFFQPPAQQPEHHGEQVVVHEVQNDRRREKAEEQAPEQRKTVRDRDPPHHAEGIAIRQKEHGHDLNALHRAERKLPRDQKSGH